MIKNIGVPPKPIHHCAEGYETEGTLLKSSAYINDVESAKLWMTWDSVVLKRMFEYSRMNSKFLIFECIFSIRIFDHMLNTHIKHCKLCSIVLFHFTRNESKYKAIYDCHAW